jgi:hypothetical protein
MKKKLLLICLCYYALELLSCAQAAEPTFLQNPKQLKSPISLVRAKMVLGVTMATLQDTNGVWFEFALSAKDERLAVRRSASDAESSLPPANMSGWTLDDLASILGATITRQFERDGRVLRPKNTDDFAKLDDAERHFTFNAAKRLLDWAEYRRHRASTSSK